MNGGISTADLRQTDINPRCNSPSHLTVILHVVRGSPAATTDTLIRGLTGTGHWAGYGLKLGLRLFVPWLSTDTLN